jgi:molybdenum cofactor biosynthesis enzyme MoaA
MNQSNSNPSIGCTVKECAYHNKDKNYCTLSSIQVGHCGPTSHSSDCTECDSFRLDGQGSR